MEIKKLEQSYLKEFYELLKEMIAESEFNYAELNENKIFELFKSKDVKYFLATKEEKIVGFIGLIKHEYFFSNRKRISDLGFYVKTQYRGTKAALLLIKKAEEWAKSMNIEDIHLGQTTATEIEKTQKFYKKLGYKTVGFNTLKHLKD